MPVGEPRQYPQLMPMLRDQIAMSLPTPYFVYSCDGSDREIAEAKIKAEWKERYRLADLIIKECR